MHQSIKELPLSLLNGQLDEDTIIIFSDAEDASEKVNRALLFTLDEAFSILDAKYAVLNKDPENFQVKLSVSVDVSHFSPVDTLVRNHPNLNIDTLLLNQINSQNGDNTQDESIFQLPFEQWEQDWLEAYTDQIIAIIPTPLYIYDPHGSEVEDDDKTQFKRRLKVAQKMFEDMLYDTPF